MSERATESWRGKSWYDQTPAEREAARQAHLDAVEAEERRLAERGYVDADDGMAPEPYASVPDYLRRP